LRHHCVSRAAIFFFFFVRKRKKKKGKERRRKEEKKQQRQMENKLQFDGTMAKVVETEKGILESRYCKGQHI